METHVCKLHACAIDALESRVLRIPYVRVSHGPAKDNSSVTPLLRDTAVAVYQGYYSILLYCCRRYVTFLDFGDTRYIRTSKV